MNKTPSSPRGPEHIDFEALMPPFAPRDAATAWLFRLERLGIRPGLSAINELLDALGRPERRFPAIVVAGTNGKGSSAITLAALCRAAGLKTGLYTSPHLLDVRERILVDGTPISSQELFALVSSHRGSIERVRSTFFESLTALALVYFEQKSVDVVVMEAGLGGRLDATNVVRKAGIVLTSVGLDHQDLLGHSLEAIAREKLGLAAPGVPFYVEDLEGVELERLAEKTIAVAGGIHRETRGLEQELTSAEEFASLGVSSPWQRAQVRRMTAVYRDLARRCGWPHTDLGRAFEGLRFPARFEPVGRSPRLLVDTAHNAPALIRSMEQFEREGSREQRVLVFGASQGKTIAPAFLSLVEAAATVFVTAPRWYRAWPAEDLAEELRTTAVDLGFETRIECIGSVRETLEAARTEASTMADSVGAPSILVAGSNFLVAEALDRMGVDDLLAGVDVPLWDNGMPLRRRTILPAGATV